MTRRGKILIAIPVACAAIIAVFAVTGLVARDGAGGSAGSPGTAERSTGAYGAVAASDPVTESDVGAAGRDTSGADEQAVSAAVPPVSRPSAHHLLRTGDLSLLVSRGALLSTVDRINGITAAMDGYVMSSSLGGRPADGATMVEPQTVGDVISTPDGDERDAAGPLEDPYASIVVRVPEQLFDTALKRFSKLGEVRSASTSSEDVTSQYVDLRARLRHHRAVERRLVGFLAETTNVNQMLAVQDRIDQVQLVIEELSAQLKSLREATTYGTIAVFVAEKDAKPAVVHQSDTFGGTFWNSMRLLGSGARLTGLVLTALAPFLVVFGGIGLAAWYVRRRTRRGRRQTAGPTLPA